MVQRHSQYFFKDILKIWYWIEKTGVGRKKHFYLQKSLSFTIKLSSQLPPKKVMTTDKALNHFNYFLFWKKMEEVKLELTGPLKPHSKCSAVSSTVKIQTSSCALELLYFWAISPASYWERFLLNCPGCPWMYSVAQSGFEFSIFQSPA